MSARVLIAVAASALVGVGLAVAAPGPGALPDGPVTGTDYPVAEARAAAAQRGAGIALPRGGNFNGIRWELETGIIEVTTLDGTLAYNAACQWLRAWRDGREAERALEVLGDVGSWPALQAMSSATYLAQVAEEAAAGGGETVTAVLRDCDASHAREVEYATRLGLAPST